MATATADVVAAVIGAASGLLVVLLIWVLIHHSRPQLKVDVGVRGWVHLMRPSEDKQSQADASQTERDEEGPQGLRRPGQERPDGEENQRHQEGDVSEGEVP